jgi:hypothetical protein
MARRPGLTPRHRRLFAERKARFADHQVGAVGPGSRQRLAFEHVPRPATKDQLRRFELEAAIVLAIGETGADVGLLPHRGGRLPQTAASKERVS